MRSLFSRYGILGLLLSGCLFAQVKPPPSGGGGTGGGGVPTNKPPSTTFPGGVNPNNTTAPDLSTRPLYLSGKVQMEDGTAPTDSAAIQLICRASPRTITRTDSHGGFSVDLNNRAGMLTYADASEDATSSYGGRGPIAPDTNGFSNTVASSNGSARTGGFTDRDLMGCDLQASYPGFRSDVLHLSNRRSMDDPDVGILILHRLANVEGTTISVTSAMAPEDAKKSMEKGMSAVKKEKWEDAARYFQKAVTIYPKYANAWQELGRARVNMIDYQGAREAYVKALAADPKLVTAYLALASLAMRDENWKEVSDTTDRAIRLNPVDYPQAYLLNSVSNYYLGNLDAAEKSAREGIHVDNDHRFPKMNEILAAVFVRRKDYAAAAVQLRIFLQYQPPGPDADSGRKHLDQIERALQRQAENHEKK